MIRFSFGFNGFCKAIKTSKLAKSLQIFGWVQFNKELLRNGCETTFLEIILKKLKCKRALKNCHKRKMGNIPKKIL
jgi:hypothetical protein